MLDHTVLLGLFVIFAGAAALATLALWTRQAMLVGYIILGVLIGPHGLKWLVDPQQIHQMSDLGIVFLLFLLGLHLNPQELLGMLRKTMVITLGSAAGMAVIGVGVLRWFHFAWLDACLVGLAIVFSSTIIGLKLLPTTMLHQQRVGELVVSMLLLQDVLAIIMLSCLAGGGHGSLVTQLQVILMLPAFVCVAWWLEAYGLRRLFQRFGRFQEYVFLLAVAWCLGLACAGEALHLSYEAGAFVAGVVIASSHNSWLIAESLKPLRDFFLVLFFCMLGAEFDVTGLPQVVWPAVTLAGAVLVCKPLLFRGLLMWHHESSATGWEVGVRLGQISEFSLVIGHLAAQQGMISMQAACVLEAATLLTFLISSYWVIMRYPSPLAVSDALRRD